MADQETPETNDAEQEAPEQAEEAAPAAEAAAETPASEPEAAAEEAAPEPEATAEEEPAATEEPAAAADEPAPTEEPAAAADEPAAEAAPAAPRQPGPAPATPKERKIAARARRGKRRPSSPEERAELRRQKAAARTRRRAAEKTKRAAAGKGEGTPPAEHGPGSPKVRLGTVVSDKADKTITVRIDVARRHRRYQKIVRSSTTLHAHDESNDANEGDLVRVVESRPMSRTKRWRLVEILERAK
jgi:small subunit ribosomal protein S17